MIEKNGLLVTQFIYSMTAGEEKQLRHCLTLFVNEYWYTIQFWEVESMTDKFTKDREMLFSNLKFPQRLTLKNQMSNTGVRHHNIGFLIGKILGYIIMFVIVASLVVFFSSKKRKRSKS